MGFNSNDRQGGGGDFVPQDALEPGSYPARVVQLVNMGLQPSRPFQGQAKDPKERIYVGYEMSHEFMKDEHGNDDPSKPRWVGEHFPFYNLQADRATSTIRYHAIDPEGVAQGDWGLLVGAACSVTLTKEARKDGKGFTNYVSHVGPALAVPGYEQPALVNDPRIFDLDNPDLNVFNKLPKWLQEKIKGNLNYQGSALQTALGETGVTQATTPTNASTTAPTPTAPVSPAPTAPAAPPTPAATPAPPAQPAAPVAPEVPAQPELIAPAPAAAPAAPAAPTPPPAPPAA